MQPNPERDCKVCHIDGGPIGDFGSPHHRSDLAGSGQCNLCHLQVVEVNTVEPPGYAPTSTTPTPYSCENCHWPSGRVPHQAATYDGDTLKFLADWQAGRVTRYLLPGQIVLLILSQLKRMVRYLVEFWAQYLTCPPREPTISWVEKYLTDAITAMPQLPVPIWIGIRLIPI